VHSLATLTRRLRDTYETLTRHLRDANGGSDVTRRPHKKRRRSVDISREVKTHLMCETCTTDAQGVSHRRWMGPGRLPTIKTPPQPLYDIRREDHMGSHFVRPVYRETLFFFLQNAFLLNIKNINQGLQCLSTSCTHPLAADNNGCQGYLTKTD
jgi:hypothetical protein